MALRGSLEVRLCRPLAGNRIQEQQQQASQYEVSSPGLLRHGDFVTRLVGNHLRDDFWRGFRGHEGYLCGPFLVVSLAFLDAIDTLRGLRHGGLTARSSHAFNDKYDDLLRSLLVRYGVASVRRALDTDWAHSTCERKNKQDSSHVASE